MAAGRIHAERVGHVLTVRIDNPDRANALDDDMLAALAVALTGPDAGSARVAVLTGSGERTFSAGVAIDADNATPEALARREGALGAAVEAVDACPCPVIAALNGSAMGGALEIAIACDWSVAVEGARVAMPPGRLGVVYSAAGLRRFVALIGPARTSELFLTARALTAREALGWGLVNEVCDAHELAERVATLTGAVSSIAPTAAAGARAIIRSLARADDPGATQSLADAWRRRAYDSADLREGLAAFMERRAPEFTGD